MVSYTSSYRAPALEELHNFEPHSGNLALEIGNPDLVGKERIDLKHRCVTAGDASPPN